MHELHFNPNAQDAAVVHIKYRAYVDGLRAVAVLAVLFFHADLGFSGGYVGVDIFFVISGFLITGLILKDIDADRFSIVQFWERRVRRIMPALAVVVLATLVAGYFLLLPRAFKEFGESMSAQALIGSNIYFWIKSWIGVGYFAPAAEVKPLLHTWSLAVEEQFYLLFPLLLLTLNRVARKSLVPAILLLGGVSLLLSVYSSYHYPSVNFYFLHTRAWELLLGAFLAAQPVQSCAPARSLTEVLSWGGLFAILCAVFCYDRETRFPGVTAILPCAGTALIIWANSHTLTSVGKGLALRPVVFIGLISYSLYLWHWPVLVFSKYLATDPIPQGLRILLLLASLLLAVLSWKFVEIPFRQRVILKTRPGIFTFASVTTCILLFGGLLIFKLHGVPSRLPAAALRYANGEADKWRFNEEVDLKEALTGQFIELDKGDSNQPISLLVWGDSHAEAVMPVIISLCIENLVRGVAATHASTTPLVGYTSWGEYGLKEKSILFNNAVVEFICTKRVRNIVIVARWDCDTVTRLHSGLLDTISALKDTGARIWIMRDVPIHRRRNIPKAFALAIWHGKDTKDIGVTFEEYNAEFQRQNPIFEGVEQFPNVTILDPTDYFRNSNNLCRVVVDDNVLYYDGNHLSAAGAMLLRPLFEPVFKGIRKE